MAALIPRDVPMADYDEPARCDSCDAMVTRYEVVVFAIPQEGGWGDWTICEACVEREG